MHSSKQENLIGQSNNFLEVLEQTSQIAQLNKPVLIIGERGTGKELIAERLHYLSKRWQQSYLKLNCASLNENLLETELFGYDPGAFTGAAKRHEGRFERADNGTLFLDEIANTSSSTQEKLLRVVEYGEFERVGGSKTIKTDVRLIAATNEDLPSLANLGEFRPDLLDRLAFDVITLPPLRHRKEDIFLLAEHFAIAMTRELGFDVFSGFTEKAKTDLLKYTWPGNIRELKNVIERSVYRCYNPNLPVHELVIDPFESPFRPKYINKKNDNTPPTLNEAPSNITKNDAPFEDTDLIVHAFPISLKEQTQQYEIKLIKEALKLCQFNQKKTADILKLTYHQLRGYLKKYNLLDGKVANEE